MIQRYNFITGLPRSGSTLLRSILQQNPKFTTGISDPLYVFVKAVLREQMYSYFNPEIKIDIIAAMFAAFYRENSEVCFNTNRNWSFDAAVIKKIFPNCKIIVCLRDIPWILDSFERLFVNSPIHDKAIYSSSGNSSVYERCQSLMGELQNTSSYSLINTPLMGVRQLICSDQTDNVCFLEYDTLTKHPKQSIEKLYEFLEEPFFDHDFTNVGNSFQEYDLSLQTPGLHTVRNCVEFIERKSIIPSDLIDLYEKKTCWKYDLKPYIENLNWINV